MHAMSTEPTALDRALARVGDRWTLLIVDAVLAGAHRFGDILDVVPGIAPSILSARLRKLEADRLIISTPYSYRPVRHRYEVTDDGRELAGALAVLASWAARVEFLPEVAFHRTCGTTVEWRPWCPTCGRAVDTDDADDLHRL
jgi:DNA-binding HxlR family transcriptional regulator